MVLTLTCAAICGGSQHVVHSVGVQHERRVGDVVLASSLRQRQTLLQHGQDSLGHGLGPPRLERTSLSEPQVVHQRLVCIPALLPHALQLVLVAVCWKDYITILIPSVNSSAYNTILSINKYRVITKQLSSRQSCLCLQSYFSYIHKPFSLKKEIN